MRCVTSGQVFRWRQLPDESWLGVDGEFWYQVWTLEDGYEVQSNGSVDSFSSLFRLDWDAEAVERDILVRGPELAPYMVAVRGLRVLRPSDPVEAFFSFLCTPNNNIKRITQMVSRLASYGPVLAEVAGQELHRFPGVETIAGLSEAELRSYAFGYRGGTIPNVARQVLAKGPNWFESLRQMPYDAVHDELCTLKGVGPKLADCIALFAFHRMESVPVDTHIWQAATRLYFPELQGKPITDLRYRQVAAFFRQRFGDLTAWAHQYLFYENVLNWRARR